MRKKSDPEQKKHIALAQKLWEQYKDEECESLWEEGYGDAKDLVLECHLLKNARRVQELESFQR